jgi:hypothetical protein
MQIFNLANHYVKLLKLTVFSFLRIATYFLRKTSDTICDLVNLYYEHTACLQVCHSIIN